MTKKLKVGLINPQGHVRFNDLQISQHPDTGGQIVYIIELAKELSKLDCNVDILTRYFKDPEWPVYDRVIEEYNENLRIVRIKCGPEDKFVKKENLWPHINDYKEGIINFYKENGPMPDVFTSHYADAGITASMLKNQIKKPFTHTGHSLGGNKMDNLTTDENNFKEITHQYKFHIRIIAERIAFRNSSAIIASTREETDRQYKHRVYKDTVKTDAKFNIIPPGISPEIFYSFHKEEHDSSSYNRAVENLRYNLEKTINQKRLDLPFIMSASRFDAKKNPVGLLMAYAGSELLQQYTNLIIVAGKIEDPLYHDRIEDFSKSELYIISEMKEIIKKFDLTGKVAVIKGLNYKNEIPYVYRYAARNNWIFINPALHEPFGLTIVEAMASGLPVVATRHGGPVDILDNEKYGILVEPTDYHSIRGGLIKMLYSRFWGKYSQLGIKRVEEKYTWGRMAKGYKQVFEKIIDSKIKFKEDLDIPEYFAEPNGSNENKLVERLRRLYKIC